MLCLGGWSGCGEVGEVKGFLEMIPLDFEIGLDRPLVPIEGPGAVRFVVQTETNARERRAVEPGTALGAMNAWWYAAGWRVREVLALKELLDFNGWNGLRACTAGGSSIETQAQGRPFRFRVRHASS